MLGTVGKAGRVLDLFTPARPEWGVTEVAAALGVPRSSAHDLLAALVGTGLLCRARGNRYRLGWKVVALSRTALASSDMRRCASEVTGPLAERLGVTVHVGALDDGEVLCLDRRVPNGRPAIAPASVGHRLPAHASALGKVLLAHAPARAATDILERSGMPARTEHTIIDVDALRRELATVAATGLAHDREEGRDGLCCHAAPVRRGAEVVAAVSVSVARSTDDRHGGRLSEVARAAAVRISRNLPVSAGIAA